MPCLQVRKQPVCPCLRHATPSATTATEPPAAAAPPPSPPSAARAPLTPPPPPPLLSCSLPCFAPAAHSPCGGGGPTSFVLGAFNNVCGTREYEHLARALRAARLLPLSYLPFPHRCLRCDQAPAAAGAAPRAARGHGAAPARVGAARPLRCRCSRPRLTSWSAQSGAGRGTRRRALAIGGARGHRGAHAGAAFAPPPGALLGLEWRGGGGGGVRGRSRRPGLRAQALQEGRAALVASSCPRPGGGRTRAPHRQLKPTCTQRGATHPLKHPTARRLVAGLQWHIRMRSLRAPPGLGYHLHPVCAW